MDHKKTVMKSKSSNIGSTSKQTYTTANKKSWSSARFSYINSKKRGVYVEKTTMDEPSRLTPGPSDVPRVTKAPKRPRRGEKAFLARCLSILAQDTIATQCPEINEPQLKPKKAKPTAVTVDKGSQDLDALFSESNSPVRNHRSPARRRTQPAAQKPRRLKFRSKALSENFNDLYVLQPKKMVSQSPDTRSVSRSSNIISNKSNEEARLRHERAHKLEPPLTDANEVGENLAKENDEAKSLVTTDSKKLKKVQIEDNGPTTFAIYPDQEEVESKKTQKILRIEKNGSPRANSRTSVHDDAKLSATTDSKKKKVIRKVSIEEPSVERQSIVSDYNSKNKSLYNLFVDILESTFNVYNIGSDCTNPPNPSIEIEEKIVPNIKTSMSQEKTDFEYFKTSAPNRIHERIPLADDAVKDKVVVYQARPNCCNWNPPTVAPKKSPFRRSDYRMGPRTSYQESYVNDFRPTLKSQSLWFAQKCKLEAAAKAEHKFSLKRGTSNKKNKQQDLLNTLKDELKMDLDYFDEPEDFHQALAKIARDKKRTRKLIHFDDDDQKADRSSKYDCFKRRKVISSSTKCPKKKPAKMSFMESLKTSALPRKYSMAVYNDSSINKRLDEFEDQLSCHSIEVTAYDYEPNQYVRRMDLVNKSLIYTTLSSVSLRSETGLSSKDFIGEDRYTNTLSHHSSTMTTSTTISQLLLRDVYNMY